ncbi:MAG TPA: DUF3015 domain-containing protein [Nitrospirae bacterium]|nr:DUF3015 domain-containing protein [Nitrospirota bacterium]
MRRLIVAVMALSLVLTGFSVALAADSNTGCGLGDLVFGDPDSTLLQAFEATTNGTSGNQTFGITSGTSNCSKPSKFVSNDKLQEFVAQNMDSIAQDMASGGGESLDTVAELMEVSASERAAFNSTLQDNFSKVYTSGDVTSAQVIDNIAAVI